MTLVHGDLSNGGLAWAANVLSLSRKHRLIVVDRRGHGASPKEPRPYTVTSDARDLLDVIGDQLVHLVGASYGGLVALELARRCPERLLSLHLLEPPYLSLLPDDPDVAALDDRGRKLFAAAETWPAEKIASAFVEMIAGPGAVLRLRERPVWETIVGEAERLGWTQFPGDYPATALAEVKVTCPVRVYAGGRSHPALRKIARRLAEKLSGAQLVTIAEAGHDVQRATESFEWALLLVTMDSSRV